MADSHPACGAAGSPGPAPASRRSALGMAACALGRLPARRIMLALGVLAPRFAGATQAAKPSRAAPSGAKANREVTLEDFDKIVLLVPADVRIALGDRNHARIDAEPTVIDSIAFRVADGRLQVIAEKSFSARQPIAISITCRRLTALDARAAVTATLAGLKAAQFQLTASDSATVALNGLNLSSLVADIGGSATVTAAGSARSQKISLGGAATYDAGRLHSQEAVVEASGSSEAEIDSRDRLEVDISGAATVRYAGKPKLKQEVTGAGTLEHR